MFRNKRSGAESGGHSSGRFARRGTMWAPAEAAPQSGSALSFLACLDEYSRGLTDPLRERENVRVTPGRVARSAKDRPGNTVGRPRLLAAVDDALAEGRVCWIG